MPDNQTTSPSRHSEAWYRGYRHGKAGDVMSMIGVVSDEDQYDFHVGYMLGCRDRRNDDLIDEMEAAINGR